MDEPILVSSLNSERTSRSYSRRISQAEIDGIQAALEEVQEASNKIREEDGMSQVSFFLGVLYVPVVCFTFAWQPAYLWVLYFVSGLVLIPAWFVTMIRVYNGARFALDFCWVSNFAFAVYGFLLMLNIVPEDLRQGAFLVYYGCALGPLGWATLALHNGLVFHSVEKITSLFIHMTPTFVTWTLVRYVDDVSEAWPGRFPTREEIENMTAWDVYTHGFVFYFAWWLLHSVWLLLAGVDLPPETTVFGTLHQKSLKKLFDKKTPYRSVRSHAAVYLVVHLLLCVIAFAWSALCWHINYVHGVFGIVLFLSSAWSGAGYYEYLMAKKYTKVVQKMLEERAEKKRASVP